MTHRQQLVCFAATVSLLALTGCESARQDYYPLAVGNRWSYLVSIEGNERPVGVDTIAVVEKEPASAMDAAGGLSGRFKVREPEAVATWVRTGDAILRVLGKSAVTVLQYPLFVGLGWDDADPEGGRVFCHVAARESVKTHAGWFHDSVRVERESQDGGTVVRQWFAPGVGLVKWEVAQEGRPKVEWSLAEYDVGRR